jgi:AcrR family transcriptional regulator
MKNQTPGKRQRSARVEKKHEQVRQEILEVAQGILLEGGIETVTLASVAGELSMTKQALYHYFPSKEALVRSLVATLVDNEVETLIAAIEDAESGNDTLGTLIRTFYDHYVGRLDAFRTVYCQSQLYSGSGLAIDKDTVRNQINPRTRHLFDVLEERIASKSTSESQRERMRQLAFTAWLSALGLMTMLGVADAVKDPLIHSDEDLLDTLSNTFDGAAKDLGENRRT